MTGDSDKSSANPYQAPEAELTTASVVPEPDADGISPRFKAVFRAALVIQLPLGLLTLLILDMGQAQRAFAVAMLCQWATVFIVLIRRRTNPTSLDLMIIRFGIIPLFLIAATVQYLRTAYAISATAP